ncbi:MAG: hypothetical protein HY908_20120 [Myxococcales bacterium]|nr:hypothetical protein [Myxococcales bacterium]
MRRNRAPSLGVLGVLGTLLGAAAGGSAAAQPAPPDLELGWRAPEGCPSEERVRAEVERLLGGPPRGKRLRVTGTVHRLPEAAADAPPEPEPWYVVLQTTAESGAQGERTLRAGSCGALAGATALIVALTFDPDAVTEIVPTVLDAGPAPAPAPAPTPAPPAPVPPAPPVPAPLVPRAPIPLLPWTDPDEAPALRVLGAALLGAGEVGALPAAALAVGGAVSFRFEWFRIGASAAYYPGASATLAERPSAGGTFRLLAVDVAAGYVAALGPVELGPDLGIEAGHTWAEGFGVRSPGQGGASWVAPFGDLALAVPIGRYFAPRMTLGLAVPVTRATFVLANVGAVHRAGPVVGRLSLALEGRLPL